MNGVAITTLEVTRCWSDIGAVVAGQCGDLHALTRDLVRQSLVGHRLLIHVQPREGESQLVCGKTIVAWASFPKEQRWGIVGASGGVALGRIPLAKRSR